MEDISDKAAADKLRGKVAIASAKIAYTRYQALFAGSPLGGSGESRCEDAAVALGLHQREETRTLKDTLYVEALIGKDTVDTIPPATMDAFRDHGVVEADIIEKDVDGANADILSQR